MKQKISIDNISAYNEYGQESLHPLVTLVHQPFTPEWFNGASLNYQIYALFLKQGDGCSARYGRETYDYQAGTVVTYAPGQTLVVEWDEQSNPMPASRGLLFHPDFIHGTPLGKKIHEYGFFDYGQREALHVSEREKNIIVGLLDRVQEELEHPIDHHSQTLITDHISMLLDYCMRYYDRQFTTRHKVCSELFSAFERQLRNDLNQGLTEQNGTPSVAYFAEKACLSTGYFGDLIKKETGITAQHHIQNAVVERAKHLIIENQLTISEIAYQLGFQYTQHFTRLFKSKTGMTPSEYRVSAN